MPNLEATGSNETNINTGYKNGAIRFLENHLNILLQWFICLLKNNQLKIRHLFRHLYGTTLSPRESKRNCSKKLDHCE